jgi:hypothetical protein
MPHFVVRCVWLLRILRIGGKGAAWPSVCSRRAELATRGWQFVKFVLREEILRVCVCSFDVSALERRKKMGTQSACSAAPFSRLIRGRIDQILSGRGPHKPASPAHNKHNGSRPAVHLTPRGERQWPTKNGLSRGFKTAKKTSAQLPEVRALERNVKKKIFVFLVV